MEPSKFIEKLNKEPIKVNKWNHQEVRVALDDLVVKYMNDVNGFKEDHSATDRRIIFTLLINLLAGAALLYEYLKGFQPAKIYLAVASVIFLTLHNTVHYYQVYICQPAFYRGSKGSDLTVHLKSKLVLPEAEYEISVLHPAGNNGKKEAKIVNTFKTNIGNWITTDGFVDVASAVSDLQHIRLSDR